MDPIRWLVAGLVLLVSVAGPAPLDSRAQGDALPARTLPSAWPLRMAYYYPPDPASLESLRDNLDRLDIVAPHWLTVDGAGRVTADERPAAVAMLRAGRALVLPSAVVHNAADAHRIVSDPPTRATAIANLVAAVASWDGLALDFEGLDPEDRAGLSSFINALGVALRAAGKYYAIALPAKTSDVRTGWGGAYEYAAIASAADLYLVMAYGWRTSSSREPGSTAPLSWVNATMAYAVSELPPDRVLLGVPFYGYDWNVSRGPPARALRHRDTRQLLDRLGIEPQFDPAVGSATFTYQDGDDAHEVWFDDAQSLAAKLELVARYRLRGAGAWRLGQEDPAAWPVWDATLGPAHSTVSATPTPIASPGPELPRAPRAPARAGWLPALWSGAGEQVALQLGNPSPGPAQVGLTLHLDDGSRIRLERTLAAGVDTTVELSQFATVDAAVGFTASQAITVDVITRHGDGATTVVAAVEPATRWLFPDAQTGPNITTGFAVFNPGTRPAQVTLRGRADTGALVGEQAVTVDPGTRSRLNVAPAPRSESFWVEVSSTTPVVVARQTRFPGAAQADVGVATATRWRVPSASLGEAWQSYLVLANPGPVPATARIRWVAEGLAVEDAVVTVPALGRRSHEVTGPAARTVAAAEISTDQPVAVVRSGYERHGAAAVTHPGTPG